MCFSNVEMTKLYQWVNDMVNETDAVDFGTLQQKSE
jgi:hypothetical protein